MHQKETEERGMVLHDSSPLQAGGLIRCQLNQVLRTSNLLVLLCMLPLLLPGVGVPPLLWLCSTHHAPHHISVVLGKYKSYSVFCLSLGPVVTDTLYNRECPKACGAKGTHAIHKAHLSNTGALEQHNATQGTACPAPHTQARMIGISLRLTCK